MASPSPINPDLIRDLDYESMSAALGIELNPDIPPQVIHRVITLRIAEMTEDEKESIPQFVWEAMHKHIGIRRNSPRSFEEEPTPEAAPYPESTPEAEVALEPESPDPFADFPQEGFHRASPSIVAFDLPEALQQLPLSEVLDNLPRLELWMSHGDIHVEKRNHRLILSGNCLTPWGDDDLQKIVESVLED